MVCQDWKSFIFGDVSEVLLSSRWVTQEQLDTMTEIEMKTSLIENINKNLDHETHSIPELSYRYS